MFTTFLAQLAIVLTIVAALLYIWGGICFLVLRQIWPEKEPAMRRFLNLQAPFFMGRSRSRLRQDELITPQMMKKKGAQGWNFASPSFFLLMLHLSYLNVLAASLPLIFGGLFLSFSWYGARCLRLLNLETYPALGLGEENATPVDNVSERAAEIVRNRRAFVSSTIIVAVGLFGADIYLFVKSRDLFQWWIPVSSVVVFGFLTYRLYGKLIKEQ